LKTNIYIFIKSRSLLVRMKNISDKRCTETQNTHFMFDNFFSENRPVCEKMWKNIKIQPDRTQMTIWYGARVWHVR